MKSSARKVELASASDLFTTEQERQDAKLEKVQNIPLSELYPLPDHPFSVMEAIRRQGTRTDLTSPNNSAKFRSDDEIGAEMGMSGDTVRNMISLTQLVPELQQMVDDRKIAVTPAYQIAALKPEEQALLVETIRVSRPPPQFPRPSG